MLYAVFVCIRAAGSCSCTLNNREAKYTLLIVRHFAVVLFTTLIENLRLWFSAEAGIVLKF